MKVIMIVKLKRHSKLKKIWLNKRIHQRVSKKQQEYQKKKKKKKKKEKMIHCNHLIKNILDQINCNYCFQKNFKINK
jgi:hypothetical protein